MAMKHTSESVERASGLLFHAVKTGGVLNQSGPVDILEMMKERGSISPSSKRVEEGLLLRSADSSFVRWCCI